MTIYLLAYQSTEPALKAIPLALNNTGAECVIHLQNMQGSSYLRLILLDTDEQLDSISEPVDMNQVVFRGEIEVHGVERIQVSFKCLTEQGWDVRCAGREVLLLQNKPSAIPLYERLIFPAKPCHTLDLVLVIDATCRVFFEDNNKRQISGLLLADHTQWQAHIDKLCCFVDTLRANVSQLRVAVLAFADHELANIEAADLKPKFVLYPEKALLYANSTDVIREQLLAIPASSGGDFVDALADALAACHDLHRQPAARKLVLVSGESPGHSIEQPVDLDVLNTHKQQDSRGDACVRLLDVDTEVLRLHRQGVEVLTLYHSQPTEYLNDLLGTPKILQAAAKAQFRRLASIPEFAFDSVQFEGEKEARSVLDVTEWIGHGGCCGLVQT